MASGSVSSGIPMTIPDIGSTQTRYTSTACTPGMFSATTWIACRWRSPMGYIFPVAGMQGYLNLKGYGEFDHDNRPDGWNVWLTFVHSPKISGFA
jgi:hypothetical protein